MAEIGKLYVQVLPSFKGFQNDVSDTLTTAGTQAGTQAGQATGGAFIATSKTFLKGAGIAAGIALGAGIVSGTKDAVSAASDLSESINAVNVVYGQSAKGILELGKNSAQAFGLSKLELNQAAVSLGAFGSKINSLDASKPVGELIKRASDFASVMNIEVSEALDVFRSGLSGETEPLKRFGLDLSEAEVKAFAYRNGIAAVGSELTEQQKVQARYGALLEQTAKTQGDFTNTGDQLANQNRKNAASWEDISAKIGTLFLPLIQESSGFIGNTLLPIVSSLVDFLTTIDFGEFFKQISQFSPLKIFIETFFGIFQALAPILADAFKQLTPLITDLFNAFQQVSAELNGALVVSIEQLATTLMPVFIDIFKQLAPVIAELLPVVAGLVLSLTSALAPILPIVADLVLAIVPIIVELLNAIIPVVAEIINALVPALAQIVQVVGVVLQAILPLISLIVSALVPVIQGLTPVLVFVANLLGTLVTNAVSGLTGTINFLIGVFTALYNTATTVYPAIYNAIVSAFGQIGAFFSGVINTITGFGSSLFNSGVAIFNDFVNGIKSALGKVVSVVKDGLEGIRKLFPFSPAKEGPFSGSGYTDKSGIALATDFGAGITKGMQTARRDVVDELNAFQSEFAIANQQSINSTPSLAQIFFTGNIYGSADDIARSVQEKQERALAVMGVESAVLG